MTLAREPKQCFIKAASALPGQVEGQVEGQVVGQVELSELTLSWELSGQLSGGWGSATPCRATTRATRGSPEAKSLLKYCNLQYKSPRATISLRKIEGWSQKVFQSIAIYNTRARERPFRLVNLMLGVTIVNFWDSRRSPSTSL